MIQNIGQQPNSFLSHHRIKAASSYGMYFQWRLPFFRRFPLHFFRIFKRRNDVENLTLLSNVRFFILHYLVM